MDPIVKKLGAKLDYGINFADWLEELVVSDPAQPDYLITATWTVPAGFTVNASGIIDGKIAYVWLQDSDSAARGKYQLRCDFVTYHGRESHEIVVIKVI